MIKLLKLLLGIVLLVVIVAVAGGMLLSPKFTVQRSIEVNAPAGKVYALVADPREWKRWSAWNQRDPAMQIEYSGPPSGAGAVWSWKSASQGDGRMSFTAAEPNQRLAYDLFFPDFGTTSTGELTLAPAGSGTKVTWVMNGDMGRNPVYRWFALFADRMVGKDFGEGLANLKTLAEKP
jgi:uncharacterized protein YndB with AHSA1/START domain